MKAVRGWRLWYLGSVAVLCAALTMPFIFGHLVIRSDGSTEGNLLSWGSLGAIIACCLVVIHVVAATYVILKRLRGFQRVKADASCHEGVWSEE